jgi:hypothetical protein
MTSVIVTENGNFYLAIRSSFDLGRAFHLAVSIAE